MREFRAVSPYSGHRLTSTRETFPTHLCRSARTRRDASYDGRAMWELVVFMILLKIPIVYLCGVVWYAVRATPDPRAGAEVVARAPPPAAELFPPPPPDAGSPAPVRPRLRRLDPNSRRQSRARAPRRPARKASR